MGIVSILLGPPSAEILAPVALDSFPLLGEKAVFLVRLLALGYFCAIYWPLVLSLCFDLSWSCMIFRVLVCSYIVF